MKIKCAYKEILTIDDPRIIPNPENPNDHSEEQIKQFAAILKWQGQRKPIVISNLSGYIATGHGTLLAAKEAGAKNIAVDFQDFESEAQEYAHVVADNALALQSQLNKAKINEKFIDFGPDLDLQMLGFDDFKIDAFEFDSPEEKENIYSEKIKSPTYNPTKESPPQLSELFDTEKYFKLLSEIKEKKLPQGVELLLELAASRHIVFNYENIAEFYCHQSIEVQCLMEKSALVIIDFNKAVEEGFVKLTNEIQEVMDQNLNEVEDE